MFSVRPQFTDKKMTNFMVIRAGNSARINFNFKVCEQTVAMPCLTQGQKC